MLNDIYQGRRTCFRSIFGQQRLHGCHGLQEHQWGRFSSDMQTLTAFLGQWKDHNNYFWSLCFQKVHVRSVVEFVWRGALILWLEFCEVDFHYFFGLKVLTSHRKIQVRQESQQIWEKVQNCVSKTTFGGMSCNKICYQKKKFWLTWPCIRSEIWSITRSDILTQWDKKVSITYESATYKQHRKRKFKFNSFASYTEQSHF